MEEYKNHCQELQQRYDALQERLASCTPERDSHFFQVTKTLSAIARAQLDLTRMNFTRKELSHIPTALALGEQVLGAIETYLGLLETYPGFAHKEYTEPWGEFADVWKTHRQGRYAQVYVEESKQRLEELVNAEPNL